MNVIIIEQALKLDDNQLFYIYPLVSCNDDQVSIDFRGTDLNQLVSPFKFFGGSSYHRNSFYDSELKPLSLKEVVNRLDTEYSNVLDAMKIEADNKKPINLTVLNASCMPVFPLIEYKNSNIKLLQQSVVFDYFGKVKPVEQHAEYVKYKEGGVNAWTLDELLEHIKHTHSLNQDAANYAVMVDGVIVESCLPELPVTNQMSTCRLSEVSWADFSCGINF